MKDSFISPELKKRMQIIIDRIGFIPSDIDIPFLRQVPYWNSIIEETEKMGDFGKVVSEIIPKDYFSEVKVEIPSLEQKLVGATIAQRGRVLELSKPGTRKSISVLSAVPIIEKNYLNGERLKTFITCPGYIIPTWIKQIENFFIDPSIAVITRENRSRAIEKAADPSRNFVIVGNDMTFRNASVSFKNGKSAKDPAQRYFELFSRIHSLPSAYNYLANLTGEKRAAAIKKKNFPLPELLNLIINEEDFLSEREEQGLVIEALRKAAFPADMPYYVIIDEFHNLVHDDTKRAKAIADIAIPARWLALVSGTGIGSTPEGLSWSAQLTGFVNDPRDFRLFIKDDPEKKVRAFFDKYKVYPSRKLSDIDPEVKPMKVEEKFYDLNEGEIKLFSALLESDQFDGREKYRLFRYLIANPHKLLPESFSHLTEGDDSISSRIQEFFDVNPGLEKLVRSNKRSRIELVKDLVKEIKEKGEKCMIACEYQNNITDSLEKELQEFGVRRIDQTVSSEIKEIRLSEAEKAFLIYSANKSNDSTIFEGEETFRSDLSPKAKKILKIKPNEIYGFSDREIVIQEAATSPDISALVSTRVLREGVELKEIKYIIQFEDTTVPWKWEQFNSRTNRSGQHQQTYLIKIKSPLLEVLEDYISSKRESRAAISEVIFHDWEVSPEEMKEWADGITANEQLKRTFQNLNIRELLGQHFNWLEGAGSIAYSRAILKGGNAMFIASLYNTNWENTYAGNVAKLTNDIILGIEKRKSVSLDKILDAAGGPLTVSRKLGRPTTIVEMNGYQLDHGIDACEELNIQRSSCFLGDISDLENLLPLESAHEKVFEPGREYSAKSRIENKSKNLVVASLVFDILDMNGRRKFMEEAYRVLDDNGYLIIVLPSKKIEESQKSDLVGSLEKYGFSNLEYMTGTYEGFKDDLSREQVEAYVFVAQKDSSMLSRDLPNLRLKPEIKVLEGKECTNSKGKRRRRETTYVDASYFIKRETGLDPRNIEPEPPSYDQSILEMSQNSEDEEIFSVLSQISQIVNTHKEKK